MISSGKAELHQLQTVYGVRDLYNMLEVITIDGHNARMAEEARAKR